jgi:hypothetical protein
MPMTEFHNHTQLFTAKRQLKLLDTMPRGNETNTGLIRKDLVVG